MVTAFNVTLKILVVENLNNDFPCSVLLLP